LIFFISEYIFYCVLVDTVSETIRYIVVVLFSCRCLLNYQAMETPAKHYKFVNSKTSNVIYYYSVDANLNAQQTKEQLNIVKAQVAANNGLFLETVYWEEIQEQ